MRERADFLPKPPWRAVWDSRPGDAGTWLTRFLLLRLLGVVYFAAFWTAVWQGPALFGEHGLLPMGNYLDAVAGQLGGRTAGFADMPSVFWLWDGDAALLAVAWLGAALSLCVIAGYANAIGLAVLWFLHMSIVHVGQDWYAFGWEIQLLDTGLLAVFLVPLVDPRPFPRRAPPRLVVWLYRWLICRIMLGAGLIKLRGDPCWIELSCLAHHYETQPVPSPLSPLFHAMPMWVHELGAAFNHVCELVAPLFVFGPRLFRHVAGALIVAFQLTLIASGNLSFLNWLTLVPAIACFDDGLLRRLCPQRLVRARDRAAGACLAFSRGHVIAVSLMFAIQLVLSLWVVDNLVSPDQKMNASFNRLHVVNTYGAFGSVGRDRPEIVFEGTAGDDPDNAEWSAYEFPCKPGDIERRPCLITPYHYRLDWLLWFAAQATPEDYPWTLHLVWKLLHGDPAAADLLAQNPFPDRPPRYVRAVLYQYRFAVRGDDGWWRRERVGLWLPPLATDDPRLLSIVRAYGWSAESGADSP